MKKLLFIFLLFSCEKIPCWVCETKLQETDEIVKKSVYYDKDWGEIISIADSLNTFGVTYTECVLK